MPASLKNWIHSEVAIVTETIVSLALTLLLGGSGDSGSQCGHAELAGDARWPERWSGGGAGAAGGVARRMTTNLEPKNMMH